MCVFVLFPTNTNPPYVYLIIRFSRPFSHKVDWPHSEVLCVLLTWPDLSNDQSDSLLKLLYERGHWIGYLHQAADRHISACETNDILLETIIQLNDIELLSTDNLCGESIF